MVRYIVKTACDNVGGPEELAVLVGVRDPRTVTRWLDGASTPQPRHHETIRQLAGERVTWENRPRNEIAEQLGVHERTVAAWQSGKRPIPPFYLSLLEIGCGTLRAWRVRNSMSRDDVASMVGVHADTVTSWERSGRAISSTRHHQLVKLCGAIALEWWPLSEIEKLQRQYGWTREQLAIELGVSTQRVSKWVRDGDEPGWVRSEVLARRKGEVAGIPAVLRRSRREHATTIRYVASKLGVGTETVRAWERGVETPSKSRLLEVARAYCVPVSSLQRSSGRFSGESIREWRRSLGLTQREAAALVGVSWRTLARWETGRGDPSADAKDALLQRGWAPRR